MTNGLPIYSQRDPAWAAQHYGLPAASRLSTIGAYGCGITCLAQKLTLLGQPTLPSDVQNHLVERVFYRNFGTYNFVMWERLPQAYPQFQYNGRFDYLSAPVPTRTLEMIKGRLLRSEPVIVYVDASPYVDGIQQHFVLVVGIDRAGCFTIDNPWNGKQQNLRSYAATDAQAIRGVILLDGALKRA
jgi:hypothetical protein